MKQRIPRFQFNILSLLFLMAFAALVIPSVEPVSKLFPGRSLRGVPFLSNIPTYSQAKKANREAMESANPGYAASVLMMMVTPNIEIREEFEAETVPFEISTPRSPPKPLLEKPNHRWLWCGWAMFAITLAISSVGRLQRRDYNRSRPVSQFSLESSP